MAKPKNAAEDPSTTSMAWDAMIPKWTMMNTLLGGTEAMRDAGHLYLPQHSEESDDNYSDRLSRATLFNMTELTLDTLVGKPFSDPVRFDDDVPEPIRALEDDMDLEGNNLTTFCREWFRAGWAKGFAHVLVDMPRIPDEERESRTREDDLREGLRPYVSLIQPENVIFAHSEFVGGEERLTHVRIAEEVIERVGFTEEVVSQIRVLEPGKFEVWQLVKQENRKKEWTKVDEGASGLSFIPLVTFYTNRTGLMLAKPPLEDLAYLNVRHWQSTADQINVLTVARFPMLAVSGATDESGTVMKIGPKQLLGTKDPQGRFYYVEHTGKAIEAGRQELMDLEELMSSYGTEFLTRKPGNITATGRAIDSSEAISPLQDSTVRFIDAVSHMFDILAAWLGLDDGGSVKIKTDFGLNGADPAILETLLEARKNGDISREDFLRQLKDMQLLSDEFDPRENLARLMTEVALAGLSTALINPEDFRRAQEAKKPQDDADADD